MHGKYFIAALNWDFNYLCISATVHSLFIFEWLLFTWSGYTQRALEHWFPGIRNEVIAMLRTWNYVLCSRFKMAFIYKQKKMSEWQKSASSQNTVVRTPFLCQQQQRSLCMMLWFEIAYITIKNVLKLFFTFFRIETNFEWITI